MAGALIPRLIAAHFAVRLALAFWLPLGVDESYAIAAAREFSWSFFDHPPLGFWLPVLLAKLTGIEAAGIYRLPFVMLGTLTAWAVWQMGRVFSELAGVIAVSLFLIAPHMVFGSGLFVLPDAPLNAGAALAVLVVLRMVASGENRTAGWALAGLALAIAMASKYQAGALALAVLLYLASSARHRHWLATGGPWLGAAIGLIGLVPVVIWNVDQDWISLGFHGARTGGGVNLPNLAAMLAGQAVYLLPPVMILAVLASFRAAEDPAQRLLVWVAGLPIGFFNLTYVFGRDTLPHWTMPGWLFALVLAGVWLDRNPARIRVWRGWIGGFALPIWALIAVYALHLPTGILTTGTQPAPQWDRQVEIVDLSALGPQLVTSGWLEGVQGIAVENWRVGGQVSTGLAEGLGSVYPVQIFGPDPRHFQFHQTPKPPLLLILLGHAANPPEDIGAGLAAKAGLLITRQGEITLDRQGNAQITMRLYRLEAAP